MNYQVKILGTPWCENKIINSLQEHPEIKVLKGQEEIDNMLPFICLFFGNTEQDAKVTDEMDLRLKEFVKSSSIQPIGRKPDDFKSKFPQSLKSLNGFFLDGTDYSIRSLTNLLLSYFGILDGTRKVFISYHREETSGLAVKLFDSLIKKKYTPFLDFYSVKEGVDFQENLRHELMDSDIVILLDTPGFNSSPYCMEEFNICNSQSIPVLDIRFNVDQRKNLHCFCDYYETGIDAKEACSNVGLVDKIVCLMESCRARAFCIKRKFVVDEFHKRCNDFGLSIVEQGGFLRCDTTQECFFPLTHIPSAEDLFRTKCLVEKTPLFTTYNKQILYNGNYCHPVALEQIRWWNEHLPIKTYNITQ